MRDYLLNAPLSRGGRLWCDRVLEGVDKSDRTCLNLFGQAMRWVGATVNIANIFLERAGVRTMEELTEYLEAGKRFKLSQNNATLTPAEYGIEAMSMLKAVGQAKPELVAGWIEELESMRGTHGGAGDAPHANGNGNGAM